MNNKTTVTFSLTPLGFIVFVVFLILKLVGVTEMSWFWVFFPLWIPIAFGIVISLIMLLICFIFYKIVR